MTNNRKQIILISISILLTSSINACKQQPNVDTLSKEVLNLHDEVMNEDGKAINQKMALDSLIRANSASADSINV